MTGTYLRSWYLRNWRARTGCVVLISFLSTGQLDAQAGRKRKTWTDPKVAAKEDPGFSLQGEYATPGTGVQVIALGQERFRAVTYPGGLDALACVQWMRASSPLPAHPAFRRCRGETTSVPCGPRECTRCRPPCLIPSCRRAAYWIPLD